MKQPRACGVFFLNLHLGLYLNKSFLIWCSRFFFDPRDFECGQDDFTTRNQSFPGMSRAQFFFPLSRAQFSRPVYNFFPALPRTIIFLLSLVHFFLPLSRAQFFSRSLR
jgi:hypothetical protein